MRNNVMYNASGAYDPTAGEAISHIVGHAHGKVYKYIIDAIPKSLNKYAGRSNKWEYREDKKYWTDLVCYSCINNRPRKPIVKATVTITYFFPTKTRRDPDNYSGKMIMDGLVAAGVLKDDSFGCVELLLRGEYEKVNPRTEIIIEVKK